MQEHTSCHKAIDACLESRSFSIAHLYSSDKPMSMHIHDSYEIYFSISGGKQFLIDNRLYDIHPGDLFFINQFESHYLTQVDREVHERILVCIYPDYLKNLCTPSTDLDCCFHRRSLSSPHCIHLSEEEQKRFVYYIHRLGSVEGFGAEVMEQALFAELMVFLCRIFLRNRDNTAAIQESQKPRDPRMDEILSYINQNIAHDLTIDALSKQFFISSTYLCRIFKSTTGMTINKYVVAKRIALAKEYLSHGCSVGETCEKCGFHDYSNFSKAFTRAVGISPGKYAQFNS